MIEFVDKTKIREIVKACLNHEDCCLVYLNGRWIKDKMDYYKTLKKQLQLNDSFSNNLNAYKDMMCDPYTYYNQSNIVFVIENAHNFLKKDPIFRQKVEMVFLADIIPFFSRQGHKGHEGHDLVVGQKDTKLSIYVEVAPNKSPDMFKKARVNEQDSSLGEK